MPTLKESAEQFLQLENIAIAGVSATKKNVANYIYDKLKKSGKSVFAVNPKGGEIDGKPCYASLSDVPVKIDGVILGTSPKASLHVVTECATLGIKHAWIHKSLDNGSYSEEAEIFCRDNGIELIPAGCPLMYCKPVDFAHKCIKWFLHTTGKLPKSYN